VGRRAMNYKVESQITNQDGTEKVGMSMTPRHIIHKNSNISN
jgi:hypothetical protein